MINKIVDFIDHKKDEMKDRIKFDPAGLDMYTASIATANEIREKIYELLDDGEDDNVEISLYQNDIQKKVIAWANQRDLIDHDNIKSQTLKLAEEVGELCSAILKEDKYLQKDAIGDIQIVLIILAAQLKINYNSAIFSAYSEIKNRQGKTINGSFIKNQ
jgi:NTP pyrophosphatase (non-canonical NTP hydrolase)